MCCPPTPTPSSSLTAPPNLLQPSAWRGWVDDRRGRCSPSARQQRAPHRLPLTFAVGLCARVAAHEAGRAVGGGRGAGRRAGGGGQALVRGGVVQGPVACERRGRRLVFVQAAPQPRRLQAERAPGRGPWARVQRRAQPVQGAPASVGHLGEGAAAHCQPSSPLPQGLGVGLTLQTAREPLEQGLGSWEGRPVLVPTGHGGGWAVRSGGAGWGWGPSVT